MNQNNDTRILKLKIKEGVVYLGLLLELVFCLLVNTERLIVLPAVFAAFALTLTLKNVEDRYEIFELKKKKSKITSQALCFCRIACLVFVIMLTTIATKYVLLGIPLMFFYIALGAIEKEYFEKTLIKEKIGDILDSLDIEEVLKDIQKQFEEDAEDDENKKDE